MSNTDAEARREARRSGCMQAPVMVSVPAGSLMPDPVSPAPVPPADLPPLETCGFIQVPGDPPLWMKCETCQHADHFWLDQVVRCRCGARYDHARRPDGGTVPLERLRFVEFKKGPASLQDTELDPRRLALLGLVLVSILGGLGWWLLG